MKRPPGFDRLGYDMHQDFFYEPGLSMEQFATLLAAGLRDVKERSDTADYIAELLGSEITDDELIELWRSTGAQATYTKPYIRPFLGALERALRKGTISQTIWLANPIQYVLLHDWDPIGIGSSDAPRDEYDAYIGPLISMLSKNPSEDAVVRYLTDIECDQMGLPPDLERARKVAGRLIALSNRR